MNSNACTPDNVIGKMLGQRDAQGLPVGMDLMDELDNGGKASYANITNQNGAEIFDDTMGTPSHEANTQVAEGMRGWLDNFIAPAKRLMTDIQNPSAILGEDVVSALDDILVQFNQEFSEKGLGARREYTQRVNDFFEGVDDSGWSDSQQRYWNQYRNYYGDYNKVYGNAPKGYVQERLDAVTKGIIQANPTILIGNIVEGAMKLPALYGLDSLRAIPNMMAEGGPWTRIPRLAEQGVYGIEHAGDASNSFLDRVMGLTDVPLKNLAYFAGELQGNGRLGVQRVSFAPRMADLPAIYHDPIGRSSVRLLSYTINTYKMLAGMVAGLKNPETAAQSLAGLGYYATMAWLIGGAAGAIPEPLVNLIGLANPELGDQIREDQRPLTVLIQVSGINRIGITTDIFNKSLKTLNSWIQGDDVNPADVVFALSGLFVNNELLNNRETQKIIKKGIEVAKGEEEALPAAKEAFLPFLAER